MLEGGEDGGPVAADGAAELDEGGDAAAGGLPQPPVEGDLAFGALDLEDQPQSFLQQPGTVETRVGPGDPFQLGLLGGGELFRVLPQRPPGTFEGAGLAAGGVAPAVVFPAFAFGAAGVVPCVAADLVQR